MVDATVWDLLLPLGKVYEGCESWVLKEMDGIEPL